MSDNIVARTEQYIENLGFDETNKLPMRELVYSPDSGTTIRRLVVNADGSINTSASGGGGGAATIADGADVAEGETSDAAVAAGAAGTVSAKLRRVTTDLDAIKTSVANIPASPATTAKQDTGNASLASIDGKLTDVATQTTLASRLSESDFDTKIGSLTETAPTTDTASSGLNGRLQRIAQRITSLIALIPTSLGQKTKANSFAVTLASDQDALPITDNGGSVTVDGTVTTTPPSNASTNVAQVAGTTADTNSGVKSAGTLRVVLATDQPALTNKLLVTPDSVALPANQSVNQAQVAGTATDTNSGVKSAGTQRVVLATDQPALTNKLLVTPDANSAVNVAQINGVTTTMNNGVAGTGVQRVTLASDSTGNIATIGTSVTPGTSAAHLGKAEDAAHVSGDTGVMALGVRNNTASALAGTDGDYIPLTTDTNGGLWASLATLIAGEDLTNNILRTGNFPASTVLNTYSARVTTNTTTTPTSSTAYVSSIVICVETAGTTSTLDIRDKSGTPIYLVRTLSTAAVLNNGDLTINFQTPIKMTSGIDVITAGSVAATVGVFINYYA